MLVGIGFVPRVSDGGGPCRAGLYRHLLERQCRQVTSPDPRLVSVDDLAGYEALKVAAGREADRLLADWLAAREPISAGYRDVVGGRHGLPRDQVPESWDRHQWFAVHPDDSIAPASAPSSFRSIEGESHG